jgi:lipopolysaccharide export system protein LptA
MVAPVVAAALLLLAPRAHGDGLGLVSPNDHRPLDVQADNGIEWHQDSNVYIARGNAKATRGNATLYADVLTAHYRPAAPDRPKDQDSQALMGSNEIYRIEADGHVRLETDTQTIDGGAHGIYDMDTATAVITGPHLRLTTPRDVVTARDAFEWYDDKQVAIARGEALAIRTDRRLAGDVLVAQVVKPPDQPSRISRIDADGHVVVTTATEIARGPRGVYNADTGIATLTGGVTITRGDNVLRGQTAVVDLNTNVSRLLNAPADPRILTGSADAAAPVHALVVPRPAGKPPAP